MRRFSLLLFCFDGAWMLKRTREKSVLVVEKMGLLVERACFYSELV